MATYRIKVALTPGTLKRLTTGRYAPRGYVTTDKKVVTFLKRYGLLGQLRYSNQGYPIVSSARIPKAVRLATSYSKKLSTNNVVSIHRLSYYLNTGKPLPKGTSSIISSKIVDHKNARRDDARFSNLQLITGAENLKKISKSTYKLANKKGNATVKFKTGGTFNNAGQQSAVTKKLLYGEKGLSTIGKKIAASIKRRDPSFFSKSGKKLNLANSKKTPEQKAATQRKRIATLKAKYGENYFSNVSKKGTKKRLSTVAKKYGKNYYSSAGKKSGVVRSKSSGYSTKKNSRVVAAKVQVRRRRAVQGNLR